MHPELLALKEKFELCYKLADQPADTWLAPQLLSPSVPEALKEWPQAEDLVFTYHYTFLPKSLINRLIVRMHRLVREPERSWRSGACFAHGPSELLACFACGSQEKRHREDPLPSHPWRSPLLG